MKYIYDLSDLPWTVEGYTPFVWLFERLYGWGNAPKCIDIKPVPARVPGSVQGALREAGILPDWNIGLDSRKGEWVEHRHWIYRTCIPNSWLDRMYPLYPAAPSDSSAKSSIFRLECLGLDYSGWLYVNGREVAAFKGTHLPHVFDLTPYLNDAAKQASDNVLEIIFDIPPRWLGQFGYTSQMKEWKTRFNYTWDWTPRLVQIGIWDAITFVAVVGSEILNLRCVTDADPQIGCTHPQGIGILKISGEVVAGEAKVVQISLGNEVSLIRAEEYTIEEFEQGIMWDDLPIDLWWPNLEGEQPLYTVTCRLLDAQGDEQDRLTRRVGFKHVEWVPCEGAPVEADPWVCVVNGRPVFLQGVNFAPLRANYADLSRDDYEKYLKLYHELGCNLFRINACQFLERQWFYDLCDELGLMVWQEFPLTSSGIDNWPPEDEASIAEMAEIAKSFIERRRHHVSLLLWSGGNELQGDLEGRKTGIGKPCDANHPMLKRLQEVAKALDPDRRFIPTSPSGPRAIDNSADFGKGLLWDIHGPNAAMGSLEEAQRYWASDDALFRSEVYCSGSSPVELIQKYAGEFQPSPPNVGNPYWTRPTAWWLDWDRLISMHGREPQDLAEYVEWSQANQAEMLSLGMKACKDRFPGCSGFLLWSGHDTSPMPINSSIIDFDGHPKPAAFALARIWREPPKQGRG